MRTTAVRYNVWKTEILYKLIWSWYAFGICSEFSKMPINCNWAQKNPKLLIFIKKNWCWYSRRRPCFGISLWKSRLAQICLSKYITRIFYPPLIVLNCQNMLLKRLSCFTRVFEQKLTFLARTAPNGQKSFWTQKEIQILLLLWVFDSRDDACDLYSLRARDCDLKFM